MIVKQQGFTLIELMVTVAIAAILAAIAYPSYRNSVARGARAEAKAALMQNAQFLESNLTVANKYHQDSAGNAITLQVTQVPQSGAAKYTISTVGTFDADEYTLRAVPAGSMSGDACGTFLLNHLGEKTLSGNTASVAECWER